MTTTVRGDEQLIFIPRDYSYIKGLLIIPFGQVIMSYDVLFLPPTPPFKNVMKKFMKFFYLSFSFHDMQIDSFAFLLLSQEVIHAKVEVGH